MINNATHLNNLLSPVRNVSAKVELFNGSTLVNTFSHTDRLISFTVDRIGEAKFFGFGICQKLNLKLIDRYRELNITTANSIVISFGAGADYLSPLPKFFVTEVHRDEVTGELSITAYDALQGAGAHFVGEIEVAAPYTIEEFLESCALFLGLSYGIYGGAEDAFLVSYETGANFGGEESVREALNAIADATQTIYYIDGSGRLIFKRLDRDGEPVATIDKSQYFSLESKTNRRLATIVNATELGDNVSISTVETGTTQFIKDNPFWELREDIDSLLESALEGVGGLTINQFNLEWRGNYLLELGDKIALTTKDNSTTNTYLLIDNITYDGTLSGKSEWNYEDNEAETTNNPVSIGDALKQTFAKVDKANKQIDLVASETSANSSAISSLMLNTDSISASVQEIETSANAKMENLSDDLTTLTNRVDATITAEEVRLEIQQELANGVEKVVTTAGYTFDNTGLTVSKSGSEMTTQITEDGMVVYRDETAVLTANHNGVDATNLHATTYLIIGDNSRFEDYGDSRTGCFWIGG